MAKHEDLYPLILAEMPGCPLPMVQMALTRASIEFCRLSLAWQDEIDAISLRPGAWRYDIDLPDQSALVVLQAAKVGTRDLAPVADARGAINWGERSGEPTRYALLPGWSEIAVDPTPILAATLTLKAVLAPTLTATTLPDVLTSRHFEALAEGAKALLKKMPNQPWSDLAGAQFYDAGFRRLATEARIENEYGRVVGSLSVTPRRFGG